MNMEAQQAQGRRFAMPAPSREDMRRGILYVVAAIFVFSVINALVKWQVTTYPVTEVVFFRCLFSLFPCAFLVATHGGWKILRTRRLNEHLGRAVLQFVAMMSIFAAFGMMPLADAVAISFSSPLFLTVLSIPLLGERVGIHRWTAVLMGFVGVLLMVRPGGDFGGSGGGALLALLSSAVGASVTIAMRRMSVTEASTTLVTYQVLATTVISTLLLPFGWVTPRWSDLLAMAAIGLCSGIGQFWWTQACRFIPAAVAAPFSYSSMVWALLLGYAIWGDIPTPALLEGAAVVVASGLYIVYRETVRRSETSSVATAGAD